MILSSKDKSFLLLISAVLAIIWIIFSIFINISKNKSLQESPLNHLEQISSQADWLNVSKPLTIQDLQNKIVVLNFWHYACFSCLQTINQLNDLQEKYPGLAVISIHSAEFDTQQENKILTKALVRNNITHPVINDHQKTLANIFQIQQTPMLFLFNKDTKQVAKASTLSEISVLLQDAQKLLHKNRFSLNQQKLPILLTQDHLITNVLSYPAKIIQTNKLVINNKQISAFIIVNTAQNNIIISTLAGDVITKIGSGKRALQDGDLQNAAFNNPQGIIFNANNNTIFVADTGNHALRVIDLNNNQVKTIAGNSFVGEEIKKTKKAHEVSLFLPIDLAFFPDNHHLIFSNSGSSQILSYSLLDQTIQPLVQINTALKEAKSQPTAMNVFNNKLYLLDSANAVFYIIDKNQQFNLVPRSVATKLQNPRGFAIDDTGIYIANTFADSIIKLDLANYQEQEIIKKNKGDKLGKITQLNEPHSILLGIDSFYIADSGNNRIVNISRSSLDSKLFNIVPPLKLPKESFLEYLPNLQNIPSIQVAADTKININISAKQGWKINHSAPSFLSIIEISANNKANLVAFFNWNDLKNNQINFTPAGDDQQFFLQGKIYFCQDNDKPNITKDDLCYIKSYQQKIIAHKNSQNKTINIVVEK
jgi:thiol-disulfide isomerase/thioredoxin/DNA-binding beta-propeller fold protein YncE